MWEVLYISANVDVINQISKALADKNIISRTRCINKNDEAKMCELLVPHAEFAQAQETMLNIEK